MGQNMMAYAFDTLEQAEKLQRSGFNEIQAKGLVEVIAISTSNLVTKQELDNVRQELHHEASNIRQELQHEAGNIRQEMRLGFANLENKILRMTISLSAVIVTGLAAFTYLQELI